MGKKIATQVLHVLYEHATGYAIFKVTEFEEIALMLPQVLANSADLSRLNSVIKLVAFSPFVYALNALDNMNAVTEGVLHPDLKNVLTTFLPSVKHQHNVLGVGDHKLASAISDELPIKCVSSEAVNETLRGVRAFFTRFVPKVTVEVARQSQLGLAHSYSRSKVKFNVNRMDTMIIQSVSLMEQLDTNINTFYMRVREMYSYHYPELTSMVSDKLKYVRAVTLVGNRSSVDTQDTELKEKLTVITEDDSVASLVIMTTKSSMGMELSDYDLIHLKMLTAKVISLCLYKLELQEYLDVKMSNIAPNLSEIVGSTLGARLISHAGSLTNLAKFPASTIQIMGAENALFKAIKSRGKTPKYGHIFHSPFISKSAPHDKGRIARVLANKCSIASRIDSFSDVPTNVFGKHLRQHMEDKMGFLNGGDYPPSNIEVMELACAEADKERGNLVAEISAKKLKKKKKKKLAANGLTA